MTAKAYYTGNDRACVVPESTKTPLPPVLGRMGCGVSLCLPHGVSPIVGASIDGEARRTGNAPGFVLYPLRQGRSTYMAQSSDYWDDSQDVRRFVGFSQADAGEQCKRLLAIGVHARKVRMMGQWDRYKVMMPDPASRGGVEFPAIPLYSAQEVSQVIRACYALPIAPAYKTVSRQVEAQLRGQGHFFGRDPQSWVTCSDEEVC